MNIARTAFPSLLLIAALPLCAENLLYNSSFELGVKGYKCIRRVETANFKGNFDPTGGIFIDSSTAKHGTCSLKLATTPTQTVHMTSAEVELKPASRYVLSFWAKAEKPSPLELKISSRVESEGLLVNWSKGRTFQLSGEWTRYSLEFESGPKANRYCDLCFSAREASVWLDCLQLEEGAISDYKPARSVESAVYAPDIVVDGDAPAKAGLRVISYDKSEAVKAAIAVEDVFAAKRLATLDFAFDLKAGVASSKDFQIPQLRYGANELKASVNGREAQIGADASLLRLHRLTPSKDGFRLGCNGFFSGRWTGKSACLDSVGSIEALPRMRAYLGNVFRVWGGGPDFAWDVVEAEKGVFKWNGIDAIMKAAKDCGYDLELTVSSGWGYDDCDLPAWAKARDRSGKPERSQDIPGCPHTTYLPNLQDWRDFVRAVAAHCKDGVKFYDVMNEPNCAMRPETYLEYMKIASEEMRKADPNAKVVGFSATEDLGGRATDFIDASLKLGGAKDLDMISFHPYGARQDDSPVSAQARIRQIFKIFRENGVDTPLWNDEDFYMLPVSPSHYQLESNFKAGALSRRLVIDMGEGLFASTPQSIDMLYVDTDNPHRVMQSWDQILQPGMRFAEQNAAASFIMGANPVAALDLPGKALCYVFRKGDKLLSAIWSVEGESKMSFALPKGAEGEVYDLFGNPLLKLSGAAELALDREPKYIAWSGAADSAIVAAFKAASIDRERPFIVSDARLLKDSAGRLCAGLAIHNLRSAPLAGEARLSSPFIASSQAVSYGPLKCDADAQLLLPASLKDDAPASFPAKLAISFGDRMLDYDIKLSVPLSFEIPAGGAWTPWREIGEPGSGAALSFSRDASNLFVKIRVADKTRVESPAPEVPFQGDCAELFFDLAPLSGDIAHFTAYNAKCFQLAIPSGKNGQREIQWRCNGTVLKKPLVDGAKAEVHGAADGYELLFSLPLADVEGTNIGFTCKITDKTASDAKAVEHVLCGSKWWGDRSGFAILHLNAPK